MKVVFGNGDDKNVHGSSCKQVKKGYVTMLSDLPFQRWVEYYLRKY